MKKFGQFVVKARYVILLISILLLIPAGIGYMNTKVNYDLLYYLPDGIDTMTGQDIMMDEFDSGAFSIVMVDKMDDKDVTKLIDKMKKVDHVSKVLWYDSFEKAGVPKSMLPDDVYKAFNKGTSTIMMVIFDDTSSGEGTMDAITQLRNLTQKQCYISGISAIVTDTKVLVEQEMFIYVCIAALVSIVVLSLLMDSYLISIFFMLSIGMAIIYNLGSNFVVGEISYLTKALAAVLQLGVTMDYSIFLWHSFEEELEKYGLERVGEQGIFALPLEEYRTKVQAFKAYLRAYVRKHLDSQDTVLFVESRMNEERTLTTMLQTNLTSEEE